MIIGLEVRKGDVFEQLKSVTEVGSGRILRLKSKYQFIVYLLLRNKFRKI